MSAMNSVARTAALALDHVKARFVPFTNVKLAIVISFPDSPASNMLIGDHTPDSLLTVAADLATASNIEHANLNRDQVGEFERVEKVTKQ